jgi:predicted permease
MIEKIAAIVFPVFAVVTVGFLYGRRHAPDMGAANRLNLEVFTPALILSVLISKDFHLTEYRGLALGALLVVLGSGLLAWPAARLLGYRTRTFVPPMMFTNSGNMGLPLAVFAFGEQTLPAAVILFLVENLLHFTLGNAMLEGRVHPLVLLRLRMLQATLLGLGLGLLEIPLYAPLRTAVDLLGQVSIPLMLFALGVRLTAVDLGDWRIGLVGALLCPLSGVAVALAIASPLGLQGTDLALLILFGALPPAVLNYMLAEMFDQEPSRVASIVLIGNLGSVVVIPLTLAFVRRIGGRIQGAARGA